jgi:hypothetical protein
VMVTLGARIGVLVCLFQKGLMVSIIFFIVSLTVK